MSVDTGALPTGRVGLTSSSGALLLATGEGLGSGPNSESGVGEGAGFTRRGREDCACAGKMAAVANNTATMPRAKKNGIVGVTFRLIITSDSFRFAQVFQRKREELEACIPMPAGQLRFAGQTTETKGGQPRELTASFE